VHAFLKAKAYTITLRITDSWGNWTYAARRIVISRPPPPVVKLRGVVGSRIRFASDAAVATFKCSIDHSPPRACRSPYLARGLPAGRHTVSIRARDSFGRLGPATRYAFTVT
jgi:hypothetical protein